MTFEAMITKLNKAYNALKHQGQEFTEKSKVEQLAKRIKNPLKDVQVTVPAETMRNAHKADYTAATQYIAARMAQMNSASLNAPGTNPRHILEVSSICHKMNGMGSTFLIHGESSLTRKELYGQNVAQMEVEAMPVTVMAVTDVEATLYEAEVVVAKPGTMVVAAVARSKMPITITKET